jgi:L-ascorbate metabolism protein UlaG (beta-lactamase superfamily)
MEYLDGFENDRFTTPMGELVVWFLGHGTLLMALQEHWIHIDPFSQVADYSRLPKADMILITHEHFDHLDQNALAKIRSPKTLLVTSRSCQAELPGCLALQNGESTTQLGIVIQAVPAYNLVHGREDGQPFHPKGIGNGYILTFGDAQSGIKLYIAGDTEDIPEMADLPTVDVAFLPMNLPYTMTPEMVAKAARMVRPKVLYPYHTGGTNAKELVGLLAGESTIEVRVRRMA